MKSVKNSNIELLAAAVLSLKTPDECYSFFSDIFTVNELLSISQRMEVAKLLDAGKNYSDIVELTGASSTTVSRVSRCLNYGEDGYKTVLRRMNNKENGEANSK